ncbi:MAG: hypothetical protein WCP11_03095 [Candidatus Saccharibacteria bacterium]
MSYAVPVVMRPKKQNLQHLVGMLVKSWEIIHKNDSLDSGVIKGVHPAELPHPKNLKEGQIFVPVVHAQDFITTVNLYVDIIKPYVSNSQILDNFAFKPGEDYEHHENKITIALADYPGVLTKPENNLSGGQKKGGIQTFASIVHMLINNEIPTSARTIIATDIYCDPNLASLLAFKVDNGRVAVTTVTRYEKALMIPCSTECY